MSAIPLRVREFLKEVPASELEEHPSNWRVHPASQRQAVLDLLEHIGIADALLAYYSKRNGGKLTLIDGHLRKDLDPNQNWPVLVLDLTDDEADLMLAANDPIRQLAIADQQMLAQLRTSMERVSDHIAAFADELLGALPSPDSEDADVLEDDIRLWPEVNLMLRQDTASRLFDVIDMAGASGEMHEGVAAMLDAVDMHCLEKVSTEKRG